MLLITCRVGGALPKARLFRASSGSPTGRVLGRDVPYASCGYAERSAGSVVLRQAERRS
jgi:hypothetical protein